MILLTAILAGMLVGFMTTRRWKRPWVLPPLRSLWLVILAFLPQFLAFYWPATRTRIPDSLAAAGLVVSQIMLLVFCWLNRHTPGIWLLALGTALNLLVIVANGGLMPINVQAASRLVSPDILRLIPVGSRFGYGKDVLLLVEQTRLVWLSDMLLLPAWFPYQVAFSVGDLGIAAGAFWLTAIQRNPSHTLLVKEEAC